MIKKVILPLEKQPLVIYDGVCNFCNASVNFIMQRDPKGVFKFTHWQSPVARSLIAQYRNPEDPEIDYNSTLVLIDNDQMYIESEAAFMISRHLSPNWLFKPLCYLGINFVPASLRDPAYRFIANRRYSIFGKSDQCRIPTPEERSRFLLE
eukprot:TRINITY_DN13523_c0_g1_i1.p1 TRINITY_DN13523_c0_g1~~TRINITY_DN13523_c0_g1_i1.p1  ORF type:complete len:151 (-),score=24.60 TRINITY_DN13523_c0_g1_i1:224-676(-)